MTEQVCCFGADEALVGVLTEPASASPPAGAPAVLWLNAGTLHHVGPFGWYVTLARRLAGQGAWNFRFDLAGVGDSIPGNDHRDHLERAVADVTEAMDFLARERSVRRFVLIGVCSGAVLTQQVAAQDPRVVGTVSIDGIGYRTPGYYLRHYGRRLFRWRAWLGAAGRLFRRRGGAEGGAAQDDLLLMRQLFFPWPPREQARARLDLLVRRGARLLFIYTGGVERYFNHRRQFQEIFGQLDPGGQLIEVEHMPAADHLYSGHEQRQALFHRIESWFRKLL